MKRPWYVAGLVWAFSLGMLCAPRTANAVESYSSQLARIAVAAERIASTLEKAAR